MSNTFGCAHVWVDAPVEIVTTSTTHEYEPKYCKFCGAIVKKYASYNASDKPYYVIEKPEEPK